MELDLKVGDDILTGKYKNKKEKVKDIGTDDNGQPTVNGRKLLTCRIAKLMPNYKEEKDKEKEKEKDNDKEKKKEMLFKIMR